MSLEALHQVLEATGYIAKGEPAPGVRLGKDARLNRRGREFAPDASWRSRSALTVYFKYEEDMPGAEQLAIWRKEIWNEGFAPLLWIVSPHSIDLYNGFARPQATGDAAANRLRTFRNIVKELDSLDNLAGRLAMETGHFWQQEPTVDRKTGVDQQLLSDLAYLEYDLVTNKLDRPAAQALIGRAIFTQYLIDRKIIDADRLNEICGRSTLPQVLRDQAATAALFGWLEAIFNGDMFPAGTATLGGPLHLARVADFLDAVDPVSGQATLFPYEFNVIPVELISLIYEQFAHSDVPRRKGRARSVKAEKDGVYYTRLPVVSLVLDEVMDGLTGTETVLDLTCGSGVFLVEAFRRLVQLRSRAAPPSRETVRSTLYNQVYGVDISEAAVRVAAFSLYLAALELDPDPRPPDALKFRPLIGHTLVIGDAHTVALIDHRSSHHLQATFDVIVGNPPWTFKGKSGTAQRRRSRAQGPMQPRGESLDFVQRAIGFSHRKTRFGLLLSAMPFFSGSKTGAEAAIDIVRQLAPVTLVNLSNLRTWLFPAAKMPAVALFGRHRSQPREQITVVQVPWSPAGPKSHTFEITPSDISTLQLAEWESEPVRLKAVAMGRRRDLRLLDALRDTHRSLGEQLRSLRAELRDGLILGRPAMRTRDASELKGLDLLETGYLRPFCVPKDLPKFEYQRAQWPRNRDIYRSPLFLVKEFFYGRPRALTGVADRDLVFTDAYYGAAFSGERIEVARLLATVVSSAVASWFFLMTASELGIWKRRLLRQDLALFPVPDLESAAQSPTGSRVLEIEDQLRKGGPGDKIFAELDDAVFDLYGLDDDERAVVLAGFFRLSWQWKAGLRESVEPADANTDLRDYAESFLGVIDSWLAARKRRRMRAEVFHLPFDAPLRVIRFVLEERPGPSVVEIQRPDVQLNALLSEIEGRLNVRLTGRLVGQRELRVHGGSEVVVIKPSARRHWMTVAALEDADSVIAESIAGA